MPVDSPKNRLPPSMSEGVGGSIKAPMSRTQVEIGPSIKSLANDALMVFKSPALRGLAWSLSGFTRDSGGSALGGATVQLFYTSNDMPAGEVVSDGSTGAYSFAVGPANTYYAVAYKAGSPDVAGTTVNTLAPTGS